MEGQQQQPSFTISEGRARGDEVQWKPRPQTVSLHDLASSNHEDHEFCGWLERAEVGQSYINGGGAGVAFRIERVS